MGLSPPRINGLLIKYMEIQDSSTKFQPTQMPSTFNATQGHETDGQGDIPKEEPYYRFRMYQGIDGRRRFIGDIMNVGNLSFVGESVQEGNKCLMNNNGTNIIDTKGIIGDNRFINQESWTRPNRDECSSLKTNIQGLECGGGNMTRIAFLNGLGDLLYYETSKQLNSIHGDK